MPIASDDEFFLRLSLIPGIGSRTAHKLLSKLGGIADVFAASEASITAAIGEKLARKFTNARGSLERAQIDAALTWLDHADHHLLTWSHELFPNALLETDDAPIALYALGDLSTLRHPMIALVGSRNCSQGGRDTAEAFAEALAEGGLVVVSGLAQGIDAAAHTGALRAKRAGAKTLAVVGTGVDRVYPASNKTLAHAVAEAGLIVSEYPLATPPLAENFPRRNRIISGLSRGVLVVEASMQSGSLITARLAAEQSRDVFAIPGSIHSTFHKGCHHLIKQGAKLVETAQDVFDELGLGANDASGVNPVTHSTPAKHQTRRNPDAKDHEDQHTEQPDLALSRFIEFTPIDVDALVEKSGLPVDQVVTELTLLELSGRVESLPGALWQRRR
jgi:DNA processing protein